MASCIGVEIGGTKLQVVTGRTDGTILERRRFHVNPTDGAPGIRQQITEGVRELSSASVATAIGVGFGGPVNGRTGRIAKSHQIEGWSEFPLGEWLQEISGLPVVVENDSNLATLAEARQGAGQGFSPVFYFNLGSGVGGGLAVGGRIYHGNPPGEMEFGHLRLDRTGAVVEDRCSGWAIDRRLRSLATEDPKSPLARLIGQKTGGEARHWRAAIDAGDKGARALLDQLAGDLGFALSHAVHLLHPEVLILGGGLSLMGECLRGAVASALERHLMEVFRPGPELRLASLGEDAVPVGALLLAGDASPTS